MLLSTLPWKALSITAFQERRRLLRAPSCSHLQLLDLCSGDRSSKSAAVSDSLRVLEWAKVCNAVASFAGTPLGREAAKAQLWSVDVSYEESRRLLEETTAAMEMIKYGAGGLDFAGVDVVLVKSAIDRASRGLPIEGIEAKCTASLIQFAESLQTILKAAIREDKDLYNLFMPLSQLILDVPISRSFVKSVDQVIDEDGSIKDCASPELKRARDLVRAVERKLHQLMDKLTRSEKNEAYYLEVCNINGRWCLKTLSDNFLKFDGLLLSSGSDVSGLIEPIAAVPLNDELQHAIASVAKAEEDVLSKLTDKMMGEVDVIQQLLQTVIKLDAVTARAKYSTAYGGSYPDLFMPHYEHGVFVAKADGDRTFNKSLSSLAQREWKLYLSKAYHPLLLQKHRESLDKAKKEIADTTAEIRRRRLQGNVDDNMDSYLVSTRNRVADLEKDLPVAVDFMVPLKTDVLIITGPNTGGKTISLKTVGLASLMAKTGLYVLASEPVKIPWFDAIYADIGDEQSLIQSLSTFSGRLRQISMIRAQSSNKSLVLLDEVGAGTNPLEGAALGMSVLESFAEAGSFFTMATTHHGELKTLKYSNHAFENACVEFDEESLRPTYKILWGVPGRSNAINIAERLGLPSHVLDNARKLCGGASAEINGVILDMERCKQDFQQNLQKAQDYLLLSRKLHENLAMARERVTSHIFHLKNKKMRAISDTATVAHSILRNKLQWFRESAAAQKISQNGVADASKSSLETFKQSSLSAETSPERTISVDSKQFSGGKLKKPIPTDSSSERTGSSAAVEHSPDKQILLPDVGDMVIVPSLGKQAMVLKVESSKGQIFLQTGNIKLRLKLSDIKIPKFRTKRG